jgi:hypothetical protein
MDALKKRAEASYTTGERVQAARFIDGDEVLFPAVILGRVAGRAPLWRVRFEDGTQERVPALFVWKE